jgi:hypothetical protein
MQKEQARMALVRMHEHLSRQFPEVCPLNTVNDRGLEDRPLRGVQPEHKPVPPIAGIGKSARPSAEQLVEQVRAGVISRNEARSALNLPPIDTREADTVPVAAFKATPEDGQDFFADADVYKSFKKMRKKLGKKVLAGKMTVDEARAKMGRQFAQKGADEGVGGNVQKAAAVRVSPVTSTVPGAEVVYSVSGAVDPEVIKAAVREALHVEPAPVAEIKSFDPSPAIEAAVTKAMTPLLERIDAQDKALAENQRVLDAIADQPDPSTAAFSGLAFQPVNKSRRPAGVTEVAESAARAQAMIRRNLEHTYSTHSNPYIREKAAEALAQLGVEAAPMT